MQEVARLAGRMPKYQKVNDAVATDEPAPCAGAQGFARGLPRSKVAGARWTPGDYIALACEGYGKNALVYRAVRLIAESVGSLTFLHLRAMSSIARIRC